MIPKLISCLIMESNRDGLGNTGWLWHSLRLLSHVNIIVFNMWRMSSLVRESYLDSICGHEISKLLHLLKVVERKLNALSIVEEEHTMSCDHCISVLDLLIQAMTKNMLDQIVKAQYEVSSTYE